MIIEWEGIGITCWLSVNTFLKSMLKTQNHKWGFAGLRGGGAGEAWANPDSSFPGITSWEKICGKRGICCPSLSGGKNCSARKLFWSMFAYSVTGLFFVVLIRQSRVRKYSDSLQFHIAQNAKSLGFRLLLGHLSWFPSLLASVCPVDDRLAVNILYKRK